MSRFYEGQTSTIQDVVIVAAKGDVDVYTVPEFKRDLHEALSAHEGGMIVDLSAVEFLDSTALGVLIGVLRRLNERGRPMVLVVSAKRIARVFAITGLDKTFEIVGKRREAYAMTSGASLGERRQRAA